MIKSVLVFITGCILGGALMLLPAKCQAWDNVPLSIYNETDEKIIYYVSWLDHDIERYRGQFIPRCGGELLPGKVVHMNDGAPFLGAGRHLVRFYGIQSKGWVGQYYFAVPKNRVDTIILTVDPKTEITEH